MKIRYPMLIGLVVGGLAGLLYWQKIGCNNGSCIITSSAWISTFYGSWLGYLVAGIFKSDN